MPDFGFVGGAYEAPNPYQDRQRLINWYPEIDQSKNAKGETISASVTGQKKVVGLLGCPGTALSFTLTPNTQVRGSWVLPGGTQALLVSGADCYLVTVANPATLTSIATFTATKVGTLVTNSGPVVIRDNGSGGGYAFLVDGPNGYTYNIGTHAFAQVADAAFYGADRVVFTDGWLVFNKPGTQIFYSSPLYSVGPFNASYYALKDSQSDNIVTLFENRREIWVIGERTTEVWYPAPNATFGFSRVEGVLLSVGCSAAHSISRFGDELIWLGRSDRGQNVVVMTDGYKHNVISSHAVNHAIASYPVISDAIGYVYQEDGHEFYVLTFPTANITWVYDGASDMWHERLWYNTLDGSLNRHISNCYLNFQDQRLVGGFQDGNVYRLDRSIYTDNGNPLVAIRRTPHVWDGDRRGRVFYKRLQIEFAPGVGLQSGQGNDPQAMMRLSNDGGQTWGNEYWTGIGKAGQYTKRAIWRRLGWSRDRVFEVRVSDPVNRDVVGATLDVSVGA